MCTGSSAITERAYGRHDDGGFVVDHINLQTPTMPVTAGLSFDVGGVGRGIARRI